MTAVVILITAWLSGRKVCVGKGETQIETEDETDDEIAKKETQSEAEVIGNVWISGASGKFHASRACYGLKYAVRVYKKTTCQYWQ